MNAPRNPVGWFEIYVQDMERAKKFYQQTFRVELQPLTCPDGLAIELWAFPMGMDGPGSSGALVCMPEKDSGGGGTIVYFSCADCAEEASRAEQSGGQMLQPKTSIGEYGFMALVVDPDGNCIGLHSMV
jgi:predicted enzyme related to lactoylglutathione lyase